MFIDRVKLHIKAGKGGDGIVAFRREKYVAYGGPSGGDGGKGGSVIFEADSNKSTLLDLRFQRRMKADDGGNGKTKKMHGADGKDFVVKVPIGTLVRDAQSGHVLADLTQNKQQEVIAQGGKGGRGNWPMSDWWAFPRSESLPCCRLSVKPNRKLPNIISRQSHRI